MVFSNIMLTIITLFLLIFPKDSIGQSNQSINICGFQNGRKFYLEYGDSGSLTVNFPRKNLEENLNQKSVKCLIEFVTCPSCSIKLTFRSLNTSRNCGLPMFDKCGCEFLWIYEPPFEQGEQFCGRYIDDGSSSLGYVSKTKNVAITLTYVKQHDGVFFLDYVSERNRVVNVGSLLNNSSQTISSPFFPNSYPNDLSMEHMIRCESSDKCRISLIFSDFQIAPSSILEFFDWNGMRMYVTTGNIFRPPLITTSGPLLVMRFYANGASSLGFKARYSFLPEDLTMVLQPDLACGGNVNNFGGAITMTNLIREGTKLYDCVWLVKPSEGYLHFKSHLYVKVSVFKHFVGNSELVIRQGLTSNEPFVELLRLPQVFGLVKPNEHTVVINQGFYISFRGFFQSDSQLAISYAAFNYRDCFADSDFLCKNQRCISILLKCDGFDHCGDNSDEMTNCSEFSDDLKLRKDWSKVSNFIFPKMNQYADLTTATLIFLTCTFGLIGVIFAMALLLYRINIKARHQRQIQDHIETIHAILEESVGDVEEEIIIPDDPPDYEHPPDYSEVIKICKKSKCYNSTKTLNKSPASPPPAYSKNFPSTSCTLLGNNSFELLGRSYSDSELVSCKTVKKEGKLKKFLTFQDLTLRI